MTSPPSTTPLPTTEDDQIPVEYAGLRAMVPTQRQLQEGYTPDPSTVPDDEPEETDAVPRKSFKTRSKEFLQSINPMKVDGPKLPLLVLSMSAMLGGWSGAAIGLAAPEIQATFGASVTALAVVGMFSSLFILAAGIPLGWLVDRVSRVLLVRISAILRPVGDIMQATAGNFGTFTLGNVFGQFAGTPAAGADLPLMSDYYQARSRARVFGILSVAGSVGGLISMPIVGYMVTYYGWRQATMVLAAMSIVVALLTFLLKEPVRGSSDRLDMGVTTLPDHVPPPPSMGEALRGAWGIKTLRLQSIAGLVGQFAGPLNILLGLVLASRFSLSPLERSFLGTITAVIMIPATLISVGIADRLIVRKPSSLVALQAWLSFISSAMLVAQAFAPNLFIFFVLSLVPAILSTVFAPIGQAVMSLVIPARYRGVGMQIQTPFALIGIIMGPVLLQVASRVTLQQAFLFFAPFLVISGLIYLASAGTVTADIQRARAAAVAEEVSLRNTDGHRDHLLVVRDLEASIDGAVILRGVDLEVRDGEILGLVGTNGAGKSTLLTSICGLVPPTGGAVFFDGRDFTYQMAHDVARAGVSYLPGGKAIFSELTVGDNLRAALAQSKDKDASIDKALEYFPALAERMNVHAAALSGGEQQMLALAQTFLQSPRLLLIDELSLGLAPAVVQNLLDSLKKMNKDGITVVLVEQSLNIATEVCDRLVYMDQGAVKFEGTPSEFLARPELVRSLFLGSASRGLPGGGKGRRRDLANQQEPILVCRDLTIDYGGVRALDGADLEVGPGEIVGIIGSNGAGKTTLFDAISGYEPLTAGRVEFEGEDLTNALPAKRAAHGLSRAFQDARLFGVMTVRDTIAVAFDQHRKGSALGNALWLPASTKKEAEANERVDELMSLLSLTRFADSFINELSTGTRRAVEIACQMAAQPKLLLLDEPSSGLAQAESEALGPTLQRMVRDIGTSLLVIEHDLPLICQVADRLIAMERGRVIASGTPSEVLSSPEVQNGFLSASSTVLRRSGVATSSFPIGDNND